MALGTTHTPDLDSDRPPPIEWHDYVSSLMPEWENLLSRNPPEPEVQSFLDDNPCLLPGATDNIGPGGHAGPCWDAVIRQPLLKGLGKNRQPDFMWVRRDTAAIRPICIEIEAPSKRWFNQNRTPTAKLTQALDQLIEWKLWFSEPENVLTFRREYVPVEFSERRLEPQYVLIFGRNAEFRPGSIHKSPDKIGRKRDFLQRDSEHFFTYDMLKPEKEAQDYITIEGRRDSFSIAAIPPTLTTGPPMETWFPELPEIPRAIMEDTPLISAERKEYLYRRWIHWRKMAMEGPKGPIQNRAPR